MSDLVASAMQPIVAPLFAGHPRVQRTAQGWALSRWLNASAILLEESVAPVTTLEVAQHRKKVVTTLLPCGAAQVRRLVLHPAEPGSGRRAEPKLRSVGTAAALPWQ